MHTSFFGAKKKPFFLGKKIPWLPQAETSRERKKKLERFLWHWQSASITYREKRRGGEEREEVTRARKEEEEEEKEEEEEEEKQEEEEGAIFSGDLKKVPCLVGDMHNFFFTWKNKLFHWNFFVFLPHHPLESTVEFQYGTVLN